MNDAEVVAAIRANHLKANISGYETGMDGAVINWDQAWIDPGFGGTSGPYAKVPITLNFTPEQAANWREFMRGISTERGVPLNERYEDPTYGLTDEIVVRVYPPERLRKKLAKQWVGGSVPAPPPEKE